MSEGPALYFEEVAASATPAGPIARAAELATAKVLALEAKGTPEACSLARRLSAGARLLLDGKVRRLLGGAFEVASQRKGHAPYVVTEQSCGCVFQKTKRGPCAHRLAVALWATVLRLQVLEEQREKLLRLEDLDL